MSKLEEIKNRAVGLKDEEGYFADIIQLDVDDYVYLYEQTKKLSAIESAWVRIEESNDQENIDDFYNEVQDILSELKQ